MRSMAAKGVPGPEASISKLFWGTWHRDLGNLTIDVLGAEGLVGEALPYELTLEQKLFLFSRSDTIYGGSNEIQRNVLGERVLGLPKEPQSERIEVGGTVEPGFEGVRDAFANNFVEHGEQGASYAFYVDPRSSALIRASYEAAGADITHV